MAKVPPLNFRREDIPDLSGAEATDRLLRGLNGFGEEAVALLNGGLTFKENVRSFAKELTFTAQDWTPFTFTNGWAALAGNTAPAYRWNGDRIECRGYAQAGTLTSAMATLPAPAAAEAFASIGDAGASFTVAARIDVTAAGEVVTTNAPTGLSWVSLSPVRYQAAAPGANGVFPIRIKNELAQKPTHVLVTGAWIVESGTETPVSLGSVAWTESKGQVVIHGLGNVFQGRKHRVTLLIVAE